MAAKKKVKSYSPAFKAKVIAYTETHGRTKAAKKFKVLAPTIYYWQTEGGKKPLTGKRRGATVAPAKAQVLTDSTDSLILKIADLEKENRFLKESVAFWCRESTK